jgi:hypothetical protein
MQLYATAACAFLHTLLLLSKNPLDFSDKGPAVCCAHNFAAKRQNSTLAA